MLSLGCLQEEQENLQGEEGREEEGVCYRQRSIESVFLLSCVVPHFRFYVSFALFSFGNLCRADPFAKKDWYDIKAPSVFSVRNVGKTLVSRTQGTRVSV